MNASRTPRTRLTHDKDVIISTIMKSFRIRRKSRFQLFHVGTEWHLSQIFHEPGSQRKFVFKFIFVNTLRPRQNGRHFPDDIFKRIFLNENARISIRMSLKFVPNGPFNNNPALVLIMAWRRSGDKPLSEPMMASILTHICVSRPQWLNKGFLTWLVTD